MRQVEEPVITEAVSGFGMDRQDILIASVGGRQVATASKGLVDLWTLRDERGVVVNIISGEPAARLALRNLAAGDKEE